MFMNELKNNSYIHNGLTFKLNGKLVFEIPDDFWERYYSLFNIKLLEIVKIKQL